VPQVKGKSADRIFHEWISSAADAQPDWRQHQRLRETLTPAMLERFDAAGDPTIARFVHLLFTHPYYAFEPRADNLADGDEQESFVNSRSLITVGIGGNGSGKTYCGAQRCVKFLAEQQAPVRDTPFWIIANTFEQACNSTWFQKLRTILPEWWIDWERVVWRNSKRGWPKSVPLIPDEQGRNWLLEWKSYEEGREAMQATAIGGAWFTENFPWEVFQEVLRGCREWMLPGAVTMELTPLDPEKSAPLQDAYESWSAGDEKFKNWSFHFLSTVAARDAGHVNADWYQAWVASISDEMLATRTRGAFANYEGCIYQSFNPKIHLLDDITPPVDEFGRPTVYHRRAIDWGASEEHPFVVLWGYKDAIGCWWIYDEYWSTAQNLTWSEHVERIAKRHELHDWARWDDDDPHYGSTYADPSRPDLMREFAMRGLPITAARNAVYEGIEAVRACLKIHPQTEEPGLFIDRHRCPKLARQMSTYRWERSTGAGANPKAARPVPLKRDDDCCFPAGTLVATPEGATEIESLRAGDAVLTHLGESRVAVAEETGEEELYRITLIDGRVIECTATHPFATSDGGFVAACELTPGTFIDSLPSCKSAKRSTETESLAKSSNTPGTSGIDTRLAVHHRQERISGDANDGAVSRRRSARSGFTSKSGSTTSERFPGAGLSTTKMRTQPITESTTSSCSLHPSIRSAIEQTSKRRLTPLVSGMEARSEKNGTSSMDCKPGTVALRNSRPANTAERDSGRRTASAQRDFAAINAEPIRDAIAATTTKPEHANGAGLSSSSTVSQRRHAARKNVVAVQVGRVERANRRARVFNLATDDGTYFANGVLVSNCDALRYMIYSDVGNRAQGILARRETPQARPGVRFKRVSR